MALAKMLYTAKKSHQITNYRSFVRLLVCSTCASVCVCVGFKVVTTVCLLSCSRLSEGSSEEGEEDMIIDHELLEVDVADGSSGSSGSHGSSSDDERSGLSSSFSLAYIQCISVLIASSFILDRGHTVSTVMVKNCWALTANWLICKSQAQ